MKWIWLCAFLALPSLARAGCGLTAGYVPFDASRASVQSKSDEEIGAPGLRVVSITRGLGSGSECDRQGLLVLRVEAPKGFNLSEVGLEFKVVSAGTQIPVLFPEQVVMADAGRKHSSELVFTWLDEAGSLAVPLQLDVELRAVMADGHRGAPMRLHIDQLAPG